MIDLKKKNPVYELEKELIEERYVVGKLDKDGVFETTEKMMYDFMNVVYEEGRESKVLSKLLISLIFFGGMIVGGVIGVITILQIIKK